MKIALPCFVLDQGKSGIAKYLFHLIHSLQENDQQNTYDVFIPSSMRFFFEKIAPPMHLQEVSNWLDHPIASILWHHTALPLKNDYDLVHVPSIRRIPFIKRNKLVATVHDLALFSHPEKYGWKRKLYHQQFLSRAILQCDHVITVSESTKNDLLRYTKLPEEKISVIYSGIDHTLYHPMESSLAKEQLRQKYGIDAPFFVYVSRIEHPAKNHLRLIQAFEQLKKKNDIPHHLIFAGADWNGASVVKEYAKKSLLSDQIHFLGYAPTEDIVALYNACTCMVFPSLFEGFGFPLLEAFASGAPVACSKSSSLEEIGDSYATFFDPMEPESIAESLESVLEQEWKESDRKRVKEYSEKFTWEKTASQVLKVYERLF